MDYLIPTRKQDPVIKKVQKKKKGKKKTYHLVDFVVPTDYRGKKVEIKKTTEKAEEREGDGDTN